MNNEPHVRQLNLSCPFSSTHRGSASDAFLFLDAGRPKSPSLVVWGTSAARPVTTEAATAGPVISRTAGPPSGPVMCAFATLNSPAGYGGDTIISTTMEQQKPMVVVAPNLNNNGKMATVHRFSPRYLNVDFPLLRRLSPEYFLGGALASTSVGPVGQTRHDVSRDDP